MRNAVDGNAHEAWGAMPFQESSMRRGADQNGSTCRSFKPSNIWSLRVSLSGSGRALRLLVFALSLLVLWTGAARAQTTPSIPQGNSVSLTYQWQTFGTGTTGAAWTITDSGGALVAGPGATKGWNVVRNEAASTLKITVPPAAPIAANYTATFWLPPSGSYISRNVVIFNVVAANTVPAAPTNLSATGHNAEVTLLWNASSLATGYTIKRATATGGPYTTLGSPSNTQWSDTSVSNGTTYFYVVSGSNAAGSSANSNEASAMPVGTRPLPPTGLTATPDDGAVALSWSAVSGAVSYRVYRSAVSGGPYQQIASQSAPSYVDTVVVNGATYFYVVTAVTSGGESSASNEAVATPTARPTAPLNLTAVAGDGEVYLSWSASTRAAAYEVWRSANGAAFVLAATTTATTRTDTGLTNGTPYEYYVRAINAGGAGAESNHVTIRPGAALPYAPGVPTFSSITATSVVAIAPALPTRATSLTLQRRAGGYFMPGGSGTYVDVASGLAGGAQTTVSGLTPNSTYYFRYLAMGSGGSTPGNEASVTTLPPAPLAPETPIFTNILPTSVTALSPALPTYASSLTLQRKLPTDPDTAYVNVQTGIGGSSSANASGLTPGTAYTFRFVAVGSGGSANGAAASVTTAPAAPGAPILSGATSTSVVATMPALPVGALSLSLQMKSYSMYGGTSVYVDVATGLAGGATTTVSGLTPNTSYTFRCVAVGVSASTPGTLEAYITTLQQAPGAPDAPRFGTPYPTSVTVFTPPLPPFAASLTLQRKLASDPDTSYVNVATGLSGNSSTTVSGLTAGTSYAFRFVAVNNGGSTPGVAATITMPPAAPGAPTFASITSSSVVVTMPALSSGANSLSLQRKLTSQNNFMNPDADYLTVTTGLAGGATYTDSGLNPSTGYTYRAVAVGAGGGTAGTTAAMTTLSAAVATPGLPTFANVAPTTLTVIAPALPSGATSLTLQKKLASDPDTSYVNVATGLAGGAQTSVSGLTPGASYSFRYVAVGAGGSTPGLGVDITMPPAAPGAPTFSSITATSVVVTAPALPQGALSLTLQRKIGSGGPMMQGTYENVASGLGAGAQTTVTGLTPSTGGGFMGGTSSIYTFRYLAVGAGGSTGGTEASVTMLPPAPDAPGVPTFSAIITTTLTATAPSLPANANTLTLQKKLASDPDTSYVTVQANVYGGGQSSVTGLSAATAYTFRYLAVGTGGSTTGAGAGVTTAPPAPLAPTFTSITDTSLNVVLPPLPTGALSLTLQQRLGSVFMGGTYVTIATGLAGGAVVPVSGLTPGTAYYYRALAVGPDASTPGAEATATTNPPLPGAPEAPLLTGITYNALTATAPPLPPYAATLTLQKKLASDPDTSYANLAIGLAAGTQTSVTGLSATTAYSFRYVAVNATGSTPGASATVTTPAQPPDAPAAPVLTNVTQNTLTATLPALPARATSLTLQYQASSMGMGSGPWIDAATGQAGGAVVPVTGLAAATSYLFRCVAVGDGGSTPGANVYINTVGGVPPAPGAPQFKNFSMDGVTVVAPALPQSASSLTLQYKVTGTSDSTYLVLASNLAGGAETWVGVLDDNVSYDFRYVAINSYGNAPGQVATLFMPAPSFAWMPDDVISCAGIRWPFNGATIQVGTRGHLSSYLATDWDQRTLTFNGESVPKEHSDTVNYLWSASGGSFEDGVSSGANVVWTAPASPGLYTITLTVGDQNDANKPAGEAGTRTDPVVDASTVPLRFSIQVNVVP